MQICLADMSKTDRQLQTEQAKTGTLASKKLHPEDIAVGDFVSMMSVLYQYPSYLWCGVDTTRLTPEFPVEITFLPSGPVEVYAVKAICLPFIFCQSANDNHHIFDVRQTQLARLSPSFASVARQALSDEANKGHCKCKTRKKKKKHKKSKQ